MVAILEEFNLFGGRKSRRGGRKSRRGGRKSQRGGITSKGLLLSPADIQAEVLGSGNFGPAHGKAVAGGWLGNQGGPILGGRKSRRGGRKSYRGGNHIVGANASLLEQGGIAPGILCPSGQPQARVTQTLGATACGTARGGRKSRRRGRKSRRRGRKSRRRGRKSRRRGRKSRR